MPSYFELLEAGPFPKHFDVWAEQGRYFHQLHAQMIGVMISELQAPLFQMGYVAGREASLQIAANTIPDVFIGQLHENPPKHEKYSRLAATLDLELGEVFTEAIEPELDALYIKSQATGELVTIVEIVSPSNKVNSEDIERYQIRRSNLLWNKIHVVEIDLTRSVKRLIKSDLALKFAYHIALHLYDEEPRFIGIGLQESLKKIGLPLRGELIALDLDMIYRQAYRQLMIASQIEKDWQYHEEKLVFPSLITEGERQDLLESVHEWQAALKIATQNR